MASTFAVATARPMRVGWCIPQGSIQHLRQALQFTHMLWGGTYNPILAIGEDPKLVDQLIKVFGVELLYSLLDDRDTSATFLGRYPHLDSPFFHDDAMRGGGNGSSSPQLVDLRPLTEALRNHDRRTEAADRPPAVIAACEPSDPLHDIVLSTFGAFPPGPDGRLVHDAFVTNLRGDHIRIAADASIPAELLDSFTPGSVSQHSLIHDRITWGGGSGLYCGSAVDFDDLVTFWNLRAAGLQLLFHDPVHERRLVESEERWLAKIERSFERRAEWDRQVHLYRRSDTVPGPATHLPFVIHNVDAISWNGLNIQPVVAGLDSASTHSSLAAETNRASLVVDITTPPFIHPRSEAARQHLVVDVQVKVAYSVPDDLTFGHFNIPHLNEHYSREMVFRQSTVRLSGRGIGFILPAGQSRIEFNALSKHALIEKMFSTVGVTATISGPGRVTARLIKQMGGLQGCRVFKIRGVRQLIKKYDPLHSFTRGEAKRLIGSIDPQTNQLNFSDYEMLHIEMRRSAALTPEDALTFLLKREVLRVGLELVCPHCHLKFWRQLGEVALATACEYCGDKFNVSTQLKDRDWRFRRSGLFGQKDDQQGAIPVALTLQQLDANLSCEQLLLSPSWCLKWGKEGRECETDLVAITQRYDGDVEIAIGECKAAGEITEADVTNLTAVIDHMEAGDARPYVIFAKTSDFSPEEVDRCRKGQAKYRDRVILLGSRELEPYDVTERTGKLFDLGGYGSNLEELARITDRTYFTPRPRS